MVSEELSGIIRSLEDAGRMSLLGGASDEQIRRFERENSVSLPLRYKEWLRYSDGGDLFPPAGVQLYGVSSKPTIDVNEEDRPSVDHIVIGALSTGDPIVFGRGGEQVSIYNQETRMIEDDESYENFFSFLKDLPEILGIEG